MPIQYQQVASLDALTYSLRQRVPPTARGAKGGAVRITTASMDGTTNIVTDSAGLLGPVNAMLARGGTIIAVVQGAGAAGQALVTTVAGFTDASHITLAAVSQTATATAIAYFGYDDSTILNTLLASYNALDIAGEKYLCWGLNPPVAPSALYGAGGWLMQSRLGSAAGGDSGLIDGYPPVNQQGFHLEGVRLQGIPGTTAVGNNNGINWPSHIKVAYDNTLLTIVNCEAYNFLGQAFYVSNLQHLLVAALGMFNCTQGLQINTVEDFEWYDIEFSGSQYLPTGTAFTVPFGITGATGGALPQNKRGIIDGIWVHDVNDCETIEAHSIDKLEIAHVIGDNVPMGFFFYPVLAPQSVGRVYMHDCAWIGGGTAAHTPANANVGLTIGGISGAPLALFVGRNNVYQNGNQIQNNSSTGAVNIGDFITRCDIKGDVILDSKNYAILVRNTNTQVAQMLLREIWMDGIAAGTGLGAGLFLGSEPTQFGLLSKLIVGNAVYGYDWGGIAHPKTATAGDNVALSSVTTPTFNGGGGGVAPVALNTLGTLV